MIKVPLSLSLSPSLNVGVGTLSKAILTFLWVAIGRNIRTLTQGSTVLRDTRDGGRTTAVVWHVFSIRFNNGELHPLRMSRDSPLNHRTLIYNLAISTTERVKLSTTGLRYSSREKQIVCLAANLGFFNRQKKKKKTQPLYPENYFVNTRRFHTLVNTKNCESL